MNLSYLVDTDWIIDHFNEIERVTEKLKQLGPERIGVSVISLAELYEGVLYSRDPVKSQGVLDVFLEEFQVLGLEEEICKIFGRERGRLRQHRRIISDFDLLIASTCLYYNLVLLTNNRKHYETVERLKIISV